MLDEEEVILFLKQKIAKSGVAFVRKTTTWKPPVVRNRTRFISKKVQGIRKSVTTAEKLDISQEVSVRRNINEHR